MKLNLREKKLITHLNNDGNHTLKELGKILSTSKENVHYMIKKLEKNNIIKKSNWFNRSHIGYNYFLLMLGPKSFNGKLIEKLKNSDKVLFICGRKTYETNSFSLFVIFVEKDITLAEDFKEEIDRKYNIRNSDIKKIKAFTKSKKDVDNIKRIFYKTGNHRYNDISEKDWKKVEIIINNPQKSYSELSSKYGISKHAIMNLTKKHNLNKTLFYSCNFDKVGDTVVFIDYDKLISYEQLTKGMVENLKDYCTYAISLPLFLSDKRFIIAGLKSETDLEDIQKLIEENNMKITKLSYGLEIYKNSLI